MGEAERAEITRDLELKYLFYIFFTGAICFISGIVAGIVVMMIPVGQ